MSYNGDDDLFTPEGNEPSPSKKYSDPATVKKKKSGSKLILIILASVGGLSLLCCCGIGISIYSMTPKLENDPAIAREYLTGLLKMDLPEGYSPEGAITMKMFSFVSMKGVFIKTPHEHGVVMVLGFSGSLANDPKIMDKFREGAQVGAREEDIEVDEKKMHEVTINGKVVVFNFIKGKDNKSNKEIRQINAIIPGNKGPILFTMMLREEDWNEEQAIQMIESIELPE